MPKIIQQEKSNYNLLIYKKLMVHKGEKMGNIILVSIEVLILGVLLINIPFFSLVIITVLFLIELYFWLKIKKIIYYAIPILFLIHSFFSVSFKA